MSNLQAAVRAFAQEGAAPGSVCTSVNRLLCRNMASGRFVTFCYARIDIAAGTLTYANAGHNPPLLVRANGAIDKLSPGGTVLGVFAESTYEQGDFALRAGRSARSSIPTASPKGATPPATSSARSGSRPRRSRHRALRRRRRCSPRCSRDVEAFNGGAYEDDATLIVAAL